MVGTENVFNHFIVNLQQISFDVYYRTPLRLRSNWIIYSNIFSSEEPDS